MKRTPAGRHGLCRENCVAEVIAWARESNTTTRESLCGLGSLRHCRRRVRKSLPEKQPSSHRTVHRAAVLLQQEARAGESSLRAVPVDAAAEISYRPAGHREA